MVAGLWPASPPRRSPREGLRSEGGGGDRRPGQGREEAREPADRPGPARSKTENAQGSGDARGRGHRRHAPDRQAERGTSEVFKVWGTGGPIDIPVADAERLRNRADRDALNALRRKVDEFKAYSPVAPPRAHVLNDAARPHRARRLASRQSEQSRARRAAPGAGSDRPRTQAVHRGERPARTRPGHRQPR